MTATLEEILADVAGRIRLVQGIGEVYDEEPDSISPPCAVVGVAPGDFIAFDPTMSSEACDYMLAVTLYQPGADMRAGQRALFPLLRPAGPTSVRASMAGYSTLLKVSYAVGQATGLRPVTVDTARYIACDILVKVTA